MVRGVKRTCNPVQPFGGIPDFASLIVGYQAFCDGFAKVAQTPTAIAGSTSTATPLPGVVAKDATTVEFHLTHPATYFVDMLTLPAFSPGAVEVLELPAGEHRARHQHQSPTARTRSTVVEPDQGDRVQPQPGLERVDATRSGTAYVDKIVVNETVSQDSIQQQLQTGTPSADMEFDHRRRRPQLPGLIATNDPQPQPRDDRVEQPVRRVQHSLAEQQRRAGEAQGAAGARVRA